MKHLFVASVLAVSINTAWADSKSAGTSMSTSVSQSSSNSQSASGNATVSGSGNSSTDNSNLSTNTNTQTQSNSGNSTNSATITTGGNTQSNTGNNSTNTTSQTNAGNNSTNSSTGNTTSVQGDVYQAARIPVSSAWAAPLAASNGTCMGSSSGGAQGAGFGFSIASTWNDKGCDRRYNAQMLNQLGARDAAIALMCQDETVRAAMASAGTPCVNKQ